MLLTAGLLLPGGLFGFFLLGFFFLFLALELVADQFQDRDFCTIAYTNARRNDASIASGAVRELRCDLAEELLRDARRHNVRSRLPPRLQRVALPERDHFLRHRTSRFRARQRGGDSPVLEQIGDQVPQRRAAMPRIASQLRPRIQMSHRYSFSY